MSYIKGLQSNIDDFVEQLNVCQQQSDYLRANKKYIISTKGQEKYEELQFDIVKRMEDIILNFKEIK